jgi:hypothetical protein
MVITTAVLTTLPRYLAMVPWRNREDTTYPYVVFIGTSRAVAWHIYEEPKWTMLFYADHLGALVWAIYDFQLAAQLSEKKRECILAFNTAIFLLYALSSALGKYHSAWHIVSALKCILVSVVAAEGDGIR